MKTLHTRFAWPTSVEGWALLALLCCVFVAAASLLAISVTAKIAAVFSGSHVFRGSRFSDALSDAPVSSINRVVLFRYDESVRYGLWDERRLWDQAHTQLRRDQIRQLWVLFRRCPSAGPGANAESSVKGALLVYSRDGAVAFNNIWVAEGAVELIPPSYPGEFGVHVVCKRCPELAAYLRGLLDGIGQ